MCELRDGKIVIPKKPSVVIGWWVGQIIAPQNSLPNMGGELKHFYRVNLLWVEKPENSEESIINTADIIEVESAEAALERLKSLGVATA